MLIGQKNTFALKTGRRYCAGTCDWGSSPRRRLQRLWKKDSNESRACQSAGDISLYYQSSKGAEPRAFARLDNKLLGVELTIRQDGNGRLFPNHLVFDCPRISGKNPPEASGGAVGTSELKGGTGKVVTTTASDQQPALDTGLTARDASIVERKRQGQSTCRDFCHLCHAAYRPHPRLHGSGTETHAAPAG